MTYINLAQGEFVRYGPDKLIVNSSEGMKGKQTQLWFKTPVLTRMVTDIYTQGKPLKKAESYHRDTPGSVYNTATVVDKIRHGKKEGYLVMDSFKSLQALAHSIIHRVRVFCNGLEERKRYLISLYLPRVNGWTNPENMAKWRMISLTPKQPLISCMPSICNANLRNR